MCIWRRLRLNIPFAADLFDITILIVHGQTYSPSTDGVGFVMLCFRVTLFCDCLRPQVTASIWAWCVIFNLLESVAHFLNQKEVWSCLLGQD